MTPIYLPDDADDQYAQLVANLQAHSTVYDVMSLDVIWTAEFASSGWITPISAAPFPLASFLRPAVATATYQGHLYAVPFTSNATLLYYRNDILREAGVKPPVTWAQLASDARTIAPRHGLAGYGTQFQAYEGLTVNFAEAVQSAGGSLLSAVRHGSCRFTAGHEGTELPGQRRSSRAGSRRQLSAGTRRPPGTHSRQASCCSCPTGRTSMATPARPGRGTTSSASSA